MFSVQSAVHDIVLSSKCFTNDFVADSKQLWITIVP